MYFVCKTLEQRRDLKTRYFPFHLPRMSLNVAVNRTWHAEKDKKWSSLTYRYKLHVQNAPGWLKFVITRHWKWPWNWALLLHSIMLPEQHDSKLVLTCVKFHFRNRLAEVLGIARVIVRLAAIPPTSRLDHSSTRASGSTQSWSCVDSKLISPSKLVLHPDRIHFVFTLKLTDPDTLHSLPSFLIAAGH